ncbi:MAG: sporulation transcriptional regulator SpoIIID [Eubacteriales bacterium]
MRTVSDDRAVRLGEYIVETDSTVRAAAKHFGISKSTIHKDVTVRLSELDRILAQEVKAVLEKNKAERHLRGGQATKEKYALTKKYGKCICMEKYGKK